MVRTSTSRWRGFILPMGGSPGFGSRACDFKNALFGLAFALAPAITALTSHRRRTRWLIMQKARRHPINWAPTPWTHHISETISSPFRGAFHLSLTVLSAIDLCTCLALDGGPPRFRPGFTCPILLRKSLPCSVSSATGLSPSMAVLSRIVCLKLNNRILGSYNPPH